jgi:hypothetical protein
MLKAALVKDLLENYQHLVPYEIQSGDTITSLAFDYYGSVDYAWLVLLSARLYDPFFDFPMSDEELEDVLVLRYTQENETRPREQILAEAQSDILYYVRSEDGARISKESYELSEIIPGPEWNPVSAAEDALTRNEKNRNILLMKREFASRIAYELQQKLSTTR